MNKKIKSFEAVKKHVINNSKEYIIVTLIFIIGIFLGVLFVNSMEENQKISSVSYMNDFIEKLKNTENLNHIELLKNSMLQNTLLAITIWFFGTTVIGIPIVFGVVLYRGFCLGYTISICICIMGITKGLSLISILLLLQNLLFIPAILGLAVSGFKLYKSIVKDKRRENIKLEIIRHTLFSTIMLLILMLSSAIEIFISTNLTSVLIKYF